VLGIHGPNCGRGTSAGEHAEVLVSRIVAAIALARRSPCNLPAARA
jgi:hypothetical protein